jgi:hypothetical protein
MIKPTIASERGIALVTVLLLLMLTSAVLSGFLATATTDIRLRGTDRSRTRALYAAHGGLEKLTADLGDLFATDFAPNEEDLLELEAAPPEVERIAFEASDDLGYKILPANGFDDDDRPIATSGVVGSGPYEGFVGLVTPYWLWVTAHAADGAEARVRRRLQTVSIPIFQFGVFSETDLSFFAGPNFNFGGRVHTNGNLFLAAGSGTLTLASKVTAVGEIIRSHLSNGWAVTTGYTGPVRPTGHTDPLGTNQGSLVNTLGSAVNPNWTDLSIGKYLGNIRNGRTGAKRLDLPLVTFGGSPIELIRRPVVDEDPMLTGQRLYSEAGFRILLSDDPADITDIPESPNTTAPMDLSTRTTMAAGGYSSTARHPAASSGIRSEGYRMSVDTPLIGGFIRIEYRNDDDEWIDVTAEVLNLGFTGRNVEGGCAASTEPSPNAIIRLQRVKTDPTGTNNCNASASSYTAYDYWPLTLYDTREGKPRDNEDAASTAIFLSGVMHYIEFDVNNFRRWLEGDIAGSGGNVVNEGGFTVYFSDRRGNQNADGNETGEYGNEDVLNPADPNGAPNGTLDPAAAAVRAEDVNRNGLLEVYGRTPRYPPGTWTAGTTSGTGSGNQCNTSSGTTITVALKVCAPLTSTARPNTSAGVTPAIAKTNRPLFFRRALKIVNGQSPNVPEDGLNITSENPVYVVGPFNASNTAFTTDHAAAAIIADAVTLLSPNWRDHISFANPNNPDSRPRTTTYYRFATIAGKNISFQRAGVDCGDDDCYQDYGTDAGAHNFLRMLEGDGGQSVFYRGSIASLFYSRQAVGVYKCCNNVYKAPTRGYNFDVEFLTPALLPPKTPMFRDVNTTGFMQVNRRQ